MFDGRVALVTGGGRGIGKAMAHLLSRHGAQVVVAARSTDEISQVAGQIGGLAVTADVAQYDEVQRIFEEAREHFSQPVDILVNNAAITGPINSINFVDIEEWVKTQEVNVNGAMYAIYAALPGMVPSDWGRILNITSGAARGTGIAHLNAYSVSKAAVDMLTRNAAQDVDGSGVTINAYSPGTVDTQMQTEIRETSVEKAGKKTARMFQQFHESGDLIDPYIAATYAAAIIASDRNGEIIDRRDFPDDLEEIRQNFIA
jgi:NAD(P)-dependent dehydrogenase (short-subunit alcohol dehydrogenase family)